MKEIPCNPEDFNIYCTDADSIEYASSPISAEQLLSQVKLCSLIGKHIYISAGHIYENPQTRRLITTYPDLVGTGIVAIGLRDDCRDFRDLIDLRIAQGKRVTIEDSKLSRFLDANTFAVIRWAPQKSQYLLRKSILNCIDDPHSILRRRLEGVKGAAIKNLYSDLDELQDVEVIRPNLNSLSKRHIPQHRELFMREVNLLYFVIGSGKNLKPHLSSRLFDDLNQGFVESLEIPKETIPFENIVRDSLREMFLPVEIIDRLSVESLAKFREKYNKQLIKFREKWWHISKLEKKDSGSKRFSKTFIKEVKSLIADEAMSEGETLQKYKKATNWLGITSLIMSGVSLIPHPAIAALSFLVAAGAFGANQDGIKHTVLKTDFAALTTRLRAHVFDNKSNKRLHKDRSQARAL